MSRLNTSTKTQMPLRTHLFQRSLSPRRRLDWRVPPPRLRSCGSEPPEHWCSGWYQPPEHWRPGWYQPPEHSRPAVSADSCAGCRAADFDSSDPRRKAGRPANRRPWPSDPQANCIEQKGSRVREIISFFRTSGLCFCLFFYLFFLCFSGRSKRVHCETSVKNGQCVFIGCV